MKKLVKKYKNILLLLIFLTLCIAHPVLAKTVVDFDICEFRETLQLLKLLGIVLIIVKILLPLLLIFMCLKECYKAVVSGKSEDISGMVPKFLKRFAAAALIFFMPTIVFWAVENLINDYDDSAFGECTTCLFEPDSCTIPEKNPELYEEEKKD